MAYIVRSPIPYKEGRKPLQPVEIDVRNLVSRAVAKAACDHDWEYARDDCNDCLKCRSCGKLQPCSGRRHSSRIPGPARKLTE
jgi:hypothetical protein